MKSAGSVSTRTREHGAARVRANTRALTSRSQAVVSTTDNRRLPTGLPPALGVGVHPNQEVRMRNVFLTHVEAALAIDSTSSESVRLLGRVQRELGDSEGAIAAYKRAIVLDERDVWSMNNLAKLYVGQGKYDEALGPLARAVEIDSTTPAFRNNLGLALERSSRVDLGALSRSFEELIKTWK